MSFYSVVLLIIVLTIRPFLASANGNDVAVADESHSEWMNVLVCVKNVESSNKRLANLARMFHSVLRNARHRPIRWLVLSQSQELSAINLLLQKITKHHAKIPVQLVYLDVHKMAERYSMQVNMTRRYLLCATPLESSRFWDEVFHIGNLYHAIFPFQRLVVLDLDLTFTVDIDHLYQQFEFMDEKRSIMAMAHDQAPHYWFHFGKFRKSNPGTVNPNFKGFNTGVLLMNLDGMRRSSQYNSYLIEDNFKKLIKKYEWSGCIAYQDFFTLIAAEHPGMFHVLDCTWNRQLDEATGVLFLHEEFLAFHKCEGHIKVYHANGKSTMPDDDFFPSSGDYVLPTK